MGATPSSPASLSSQQLRTTWNCEPKQIFSFLNCFLSGIWSQWQTWNQGSCPDTLSLWGWKCFLLLSQSTEQGTLLSFISSFCTLGKSIISPKNVVSDTSYLSRACSGPGQLVSACTPRTKQELVSWLYATCLEGSEIPLKGQLSTRFLHLSAPPSTTGLVSTALATTGSAPVTTGSAQLQLPLAQHSPAYHRLSTAWATTDPTQPCLPQAQNSLDYHSPAQPQLPQAQHSLGYHRQSELQEELQKSDSMTFQKPGFVLWFTTSKTSLCFTFNRIYCPTYLM